MSLWSTRKPLDRGDDTEITSVPYVELIVLGSMLGVPLVLLLSAPLALGPPPAAGAVIYPLLGSGLLLVLSAKASVVRRDRLVSFGSANMSTSMRRCYRAGYALCAVGAAVAFGTLRWWAAA